MYIGVRVGASGVLVGGTGVGGAGVSMVGAGVKEGACVGRFSTAGSVGGGNGFKSVCGLAKITPKKSIVTAIMIKTPRERRFQVWSADGAGREAG